MQLFVGLYKMCLYSVLTKAMHFYNVSSDVNVIVSITSLKVRVTIRPAFSGLVPVKSLKVPVFHSVGQHSSNYGIQTFVRIRKCIMRTNPTSMTISAENDIKGAAKQVLIFF